jgi:protein TonB
MPKPTNPGRGGSPSRPSGPPPGSCISCGEPEYPIAAQIQRREGQVEVFFDIDPNGKAVNIQILTSSKHEDLDQAAIKALKTWKFASLEGGIPGQKRFIKFLVPKNQRFF